MAVITTAQLNSTIDQVVTDHPQFLFVSGSISRWSPDDNTICFRPPSDIADLYSFFHELGHGLCNHQDYIQDIELLRIEHEAWQAAREIAATYGFQVDQETVEIALDSYREWLHARSRCPTCQNPGIQQKNGDNYKCVLCRTEWRANDARQCSLKRYIKK